MTLEEVQMIVRAITIKKNVKGVERELKRLRKVFKSLAKKLKEK